MNPTARGPRPAVALIGAAIVVVVAVVAVAWTMSRPADAPSSPSGASAPPSTTEAGQPPAGDGSDTTAVPADTTEEPEETTEEPDTTTTSAAVVNGFDGPDWWQPAAVGTPYGATVEGLLTFRGSPNRTYYGAGPVPRTAPEVAWTLPRPGESALCSESSVGGESTVWCGSGWTGQPAVWERPDGRWLAFGAYDRSVHFVDALTGQDRIAEFLTGDIIKGSVTVDPDGFPLLYSGSRDGAYHVIALDRGAEPQELWQLSADAAGGGIWNDDWDGAGLVIDDYLFEGGENSIFYIVKLNRAYGPDGKVTVAPELVFSVPGYDQDLLNAAGDRNMSIENSVAVSGNTVYFANSGGRVQGWDLSGLASGADPRQVFSYWTGDDVDASVVVDEQGMLYVGVEYERLNDRSKEVGQIIKLDPTKPDAPLVWSVADQGRADAGVWGTPALHRDVVYVPTDTGRLIGIDRATGQIRWEKQLPGPLWQSPVVVDDVLVQGDCSGVLHAYDVSDTSVEPPELWSVTLGGCIESTPAVWDGWIYVGTRSGTFFALHGA